MRSASGLLLCVLVPMALAVAWWLGASHAPQQGAPPASATVAQLEAAIVERDAAIAGLQEQVARLERDTRAAAAAAVLRAPLPAETRSETEAAQQPPPPAAVPIAATARELAALAWLRGLLPDKFGGLTAETMRALTDLDLRGAAVTDVDLQHL